MTKTNEFDLLIQAKKDDDYAKLSIKAAEIVVKMDGKIDELDDKRKVLMAALTDLTKAGQTKKLTAEVIKKAESTPGF